MMKCKNTKAKATSQPLLLASRAAVNQLIDQKLKCAQWQLIEIEIGERASEQPSFNYLKLH
jgi:hypothetical protein